MQRVAVCAFSIRDKQWSVQDGKYGKGPIISKHATFQKCLSYPNTANVFIQRVCICCAAREV